MNLGKVQRACQKRQFIIIACYKKGTTPHLRSLLLPLLLFCSFLQQTSDSQFCMCCTFASDPQHPTTLLSLSSSIPVPSFNWQHADVDFISLPNGHTQHQLNHPQRRQNGQGEHGHPCLPHPPSNATRSPPSSLTATTRSSSPRNSRSRPAPG